MAKKIKAKNKADLKDKPINSEETLEEDESLEEETDASQKDTFADQNADEKRVYVISPNGQAKLYKKRFLQQSLDIIPGSTIFVPREVRDTLS